MFNSRAFFTDTTSLFPHIHWSIGEFVAHCQVSFWVCLCEDARVSLVLESSSGASSGKRCLDVPWGWTVWEQVKSRDFAAQWQQQAPVRWALNLLQAFTEVCFPSVLSTLEKGFVTGIAPYMWRTGWGMPSSWAPHYTGNSQSHPRSPWAPC